MNSSPVASLHVLRALLLTSLGTLFCAPRPVAPLRARLLDYGIVRPAGALIHHPDKNSATGFISTGHGVFEQRTTQVPGLRGAAFGIQYRIDGIPTGQVVVVEEIIRHPPMTRPDGTVTQEERTRQQGTTDNGYLESKFWYLLREPFEVVPGDWSLTVVVNNRKLIEQHFTVGSNT
jgi:hypothetical protein